MKRFLVLAVAVGLAVYLLSPQWVSADRLGQRRLEALNKPGKEILVGVCWPFELNQDGMRNGIELAKEEINAGGLTGGRPIRLVFRDPGMDQDKYKRITMEFAKIPEMSAVIGYYDDDAALKASVVYESAQLLHLMIGVNSNDLTSRGFRYIIRSIISNGQIARALAKMCVERGYRKFALIWEQAAFGEDLANQYRVMMDALDGQLVYQTSYPLDRADFRLCVNELKEAKADIVFFAGLEPQAGDFLRKAHGVGLKTPIIGAFDDTPELRRLAGPGLEGVMHFDVYDPQNLSPINQAFASKFRGRFGQDPDWAAAQAYDALHLLARAVQFTGSRDPLDLSFTIRFAENWQGANGIYDFDGQGALADKPIYLKIYKNGIPVTIQESHPEPATALFENQWAVPQKPVAPKATPPGKPNGSPVPQP